MAIVQDSIEKKVLKWPPAKRLALAEKLVASVESFSSPEIEAAWEDEIANRVREIRSGSAVGIPAETVSKDARKKLDEARRLSSSRSRRTH